MRHHGMGEREILAALEVSNETRCDPPLPSSEVARIARSIARYAPESDVAAEVAMGSAAAEALLANHAPPPANDWITHADDFSAQPAAINWWVKMWVQKQALMMVHGPSGGGKTFVTLDWLLHIASGRPEWAGLKVKKGTVLYLAGEGHAGLRARIAAWKHHHQVQHLDFYVSRDAVDLNTPEGLRRVIEAIEALGFIPDIIAIDTVHRHMVGDENSAADTKTFIDAADTLKKRFNATVLLVHHTGNSDEAQHRARGSSAWRGALDIEISVVPGKKDAPIRIVQRKSKDAELAPHVCVQLQGVYIPGWFDDEGEQISSAVPVITECDSDEAKDEHDKALVGHIRMIQEAWRSTGEELFEGSPYITKSALLSFLINNKGLSESSAKQYVKPSQGKRLIGNLINNDIAKEALNGFVIVEPAMVSQLMLGKK
jgi:energy-coupling factor transporter ATP-binding protein EcfA2